MSIEDLGSEHNALDIDIDLTSPAIRCAGYLRKIYEGNDADL